jgi:hypothetical protein
LRAFFDTPYWIEAHPIHGYSVEYSEPQLFTPHRHQEGKLIYAEIGAVVIATEQRRWAIAPGRALWVSPGIRHWTRTVHAVRMHSVLIDRTAEKYLPTNCRYVSVSALLLELIKVTAVPPGAGRVTDREKALAALLVHELNATAA